MSQTSGSIQKIWMQNIDKKQKDHNKEPECIPVPGMDGWYETKVDNTIGFMRKIQEKTTEKLPERKTTYEFINQEECHRSWKK